jgi:penicillin G amidase
METPKSGFLSAVFSALLRPIVRQLDKGSFPKYGGSCSIPGLTSKVKVCWQSHGIPHVFANNEHDLFLAQGYLHAQERLWQMDMSRRLLTGRLAEIFGNFSVPWKELTTYFRGRTSADVDYFMRLIGLRSAAMASLTSLSQDEWQRLQAYSDGINRYIEACGSKLPWEFRVLRYEPEPWRPEDSLTIGKGFAFLLTTALFTRLNMIAVAAKLHGQPERLRSLFPSYPEEEPTITRALWESTRSLWQFVNGTFADSGWHAAGIGSNNWVLAPHRSASGNAILCNDPHLRMTLPSAWYLMHLRAEANPIQSDGYEVWGATIPGLPCVQVGHNRWIAWGITAAVCDDLELYREKIHRFEPDRYLVEYEWRTMDSRIERIRIRGQGEVKKTIRSTSRGPVISDFSSSAANEVLSLRWTAHEASQEFRCVYGVNCARNWDDFLNSLRFQSAPTLSYVYADVQGNIGYSLAGKIPLRPEVPSLLPLDGWNHDNEWRGYIPFDDLPRIFNPPEGVIATANNRITDSSYAYYLSHFFDPPYRIRRIKELLSAKATHSINDMAAIQMDVVSLHARECITSLKNDLSQLGEDDPKLKTAADSLLHWDGRCHEDSSESAIFHVFYHRLMANLLVPRLGEELFTAYVEILNQSLIPVDHILQNPGSLWFADQARNQLVAKSLREACEELEQTLGTHVQRWHWARFHTLMLSHALSRIEQIRPLLTVGPLPSSGDGTSINMGFYRYSNPYEHTIGASLRFIVDLGAWHRSGFILPPGQSGHLFSPHFKDQLDLWQSGHRIRMSMTESELESEPCLVLEPTPSSSS